MMNIFFRFVVAIVFGVSLSINLLGRGKDKITTPVIESYILPFVMAVFIAVSLVTSGPVYTVENVMTAFLPIFLHISVYYVLLLLLMPYLRNVFSTTVTALLWIIPNYLYLMSFTGYQLEKPLFVIKINGQWSRYIPWVWLAGFAVIFAYKMISHILFRARLLKNSEKVTDDGILKIWNEEKEKVKIEKANIPLYISETVSTPVSVGLFKRAVFVVLPNKNYTEEQLYLIFRHELIHIARSDSWTKFFIMFCNAACWFNPLMWISMKKCSEDIELNCDETALIDENDSVRKQYAELILSSAGDERGFTTCLSASAKSLKFRLKNIMNPKKKKKGFIFASVVFFLLIITCQTVTFALDFGEAKDVVFSETCKVSDRVTVYKGNDFNARSLGYYKLKDKKAFMDHLGSIRLYKLTGSYEYKNEETTFEFNVEDKDFSSVIAVSKGHISKAYVTNKTYKYESYYFTQELDTDFLLSCLEEVDMPVKISAPELMLYYFDGDKKLMEEPMYPGKEIISVKNGDMTGDIPFYNNEGPSLISDCYLDKVKLSFSQAPSSYTVYVYPYGEKDGESVETYSSTELADDILPIYKDCSCVMDAVFVMDNNTVYRIKYYFDIELP